MRCIWGTTCISGIYSEQSVYIDDETTIHITLLLVATMGCFRPWNNVLHARLRNEPESVAAILATAGVVHTELVLYDS